MILPGRFPKMDILRKWCPLFPLGKKGMNSMGALGELFPLGITSDAKKRRLELANPKRLPPKKKPKTNSLPLKNDGTGT